MVIKLGANSLYKMADALRSLKVLIISKRNLTVRLLDENVRYVFESPGRVRPP